MLELHAGDHVHVAGAVRLQRQQDFLGRAGRQRAEVPDDLRVAGRRLRRRADEGRRWPGRTAHLDMMGGGPRRVLDEDAVIDFLPRRGRGRARTWSDTIGVGGSAGPDERTAGPAVSTGGGRPAAVPATGPTERLRPHARRTAATAHASTTISTTRSAVHADRVVPPIRTPSTRPPIGPLTAVTGRDRRLSPFRPDLSARISRFAHAETLRQAAPPALSASLTGFAPSPKLGKSERPRPGDPSPGETHVDPTY